MANAKRISISRATGGSVYCIVKRLADSYLLDPSDGAFKAVVASPYSTLTEDSTLKGSYQLSESRTVWTNGDYLIGIYVKLGGSPAPSTDTVITYSRPVLLIRGDQFSFEGFGADYQASVVNGVVNNANLLARSRFDSIDTANSSILKTVQLILTNVLDFGMKLARSTSSDSAARSTPIINRD